MTPPARTAALLIGGILLVGGALMLTAPARPGIGLVAMGALILVSVLFERRYRGVSGDSPPEGPGWELTGETFRDEESGRRVRVWYHPATGERRYVSTRGEN